MLLQPRKFQYKTRQKVRSVAMAGEATLTYGDSGLRLLQPLRLTGRRIFRLKIFLKKQRGSRIWRSDVCGWVHSPIHLLRKRVRGCGWERGLESLARGRLRYVGGFLLRNLRAYVPVEQRILRNRLQTAFVFVLGFALSPTTSLIYTEQVELVRD